MKTVVACALLGVCIFSSACRAAEEDLTVLKPSADGTTPGEAFEQYLTDEFNRLVDRRSAAFEKALKIEAARLRAAGEIDDLEERQLCRLNITGEAPSSDPAETSGNRGRKPDSWFRNLMTGHYDPVTRDLAVTIRNELNVSPGFVA